MMAQMSQVDSVCGEKTCLSHMYNTSVRDKHTLDTHKVSSFDSLKVRILTGKY